MELQKLNQKKVSQWRGEKVFEGRDNFWRGWKVIQAGRATFLEFSVCFQMNEQKKCGKQINV